MWDIKTWVDVAAISGGFGSLVAGGGVVFAACQLLLSKQQSVTNFEDAMVREYRELASTLPLPALLGEPLSDELHREKLDEFYRYFDLCNSQIFLRDQQRISDKTWEFWEEGIQSNMRRPAFARAWCEIAARANGDFAELRRLCPPQSSERREGLQ